jgi:mannose-6-phosphate isomerase-like protein (cupin superfamily)
MPNKEDSILKTIRPWGCYEIIAEAPTYKIKRITINPKSRLSLQRHEYREEDWYILEGNMTAERCSDIKAKIDKMPNLRPGERCHIPQGWVHRASNTTDEPVVFLEVQRGESFEEDDIERFEDDYGRLEE